MLGIGARRRIRAARIHVRHVGELQAMSWCVASTSGARAGRDGWVIAARAVDGGTRRARPCRWPAGAWRQRSVGAACGVANAARCRAAPLVILPAKRRSRFPIALGHDVDRGRNARVRVSALRGYSDRSLRPSIERARQFPHLSLRWRRPWCTSRHTRVSRGTLCVKNDLRTAMSLDRICEAQPRESTKCHKLAANSAGATP